MNEERSSNAIDGRSSMEDESRPVLSTSGKKKKKGEKRKRTQSDAPSTTSIGNKMSGSCDDREVEVKNDTESPPKDSAKKRMKVRAGEYPYPTDYNDHFETPARAYDDIYPLLEYILAKKQKSKHSKKKKKKQGSTNEATIYDPYYCAGRAATLLSALFQRHHNNEKQIPCTSVRIQHEKRDFYNDIQQNTMPKYDILVTNPPYSTNHKERCLEFAVNQLKQHGRPFFLLMPNYIASKEYFRTIVLGSGKRVQTFYIIPSSKYPYEYDHPEGTGHETSPFSSVWFCGLSYGDQMNITDTKAVTDAFVKYHSSNNYASPTGVPRIATSLLELIRIGGVSGEKRKNPRQRKKMRLQAMQRASGGSMAGGNVSSGNNAQAQKSTRKSGGNMNYSNGRIKKERRRTYKK